MSEKWLYEKDGTNSGPICSEELIMLLKSNEISLSTLVWREGSNDWKPYHLWKELERAQTEPPPKPIRYLVINPYIIAIITTIFAMEIFVNPFLSLVVSEALSINLGSDTASTMRSQASATMIYEKVSTSPAWVIAYFCIYSFLCHRDELLINRALPEKDAGNNWVWAQFIVPIYVFHRGQKILRSYPTANWIEAHWPTLIFFAGMLLFL
jgi:hypothetical protein